MQKTSAYANGCPQRDRSETERYGGVQTFMWMGEDNIVEVPFDKEHLLEVILSPSNLNKAYKAVMRNKGCGGIGKMPCEQLLPWLLANKPSTKHCPQSMSASSPRQATASVRREGVTMPCGERRGLPFVRYADDSMIFCKSKRAAMRVKESTTRFIEGKLYLKVNKEKTVVSYVKGVKYLGYSFYVMKGTLSCHEAYAHRFKLPVVMFPETCVSRLLTVVSNRHCNCRQPLLQLSATVTAIVINCYGNCQQLL